MAIYRDGRTDIMQNDQGNRITPSCVAFTDTVSLVGEGAYDNAGSNPENTIYGGLFFLLNIQDNCIVFLKLLRC